MEKICPYFYDKNNEKTVENIVKICQNICKRNLREVKMEKEAYNIITKENIKMQREKEAKFINTTVTNENIINKFYKFYKRKVKRFDFYSFLICGIALILIAINLLLQGSDYFMELIWNIIISVILIGIGICFWISAFKNQKYDKKDMVRIYAEDISNISNDYFFDDDKVVIVNKFGETERSYEYLEAIYEAKDYYYIFTTRKSAYIMDKKKFTKGTEKEFNNFIKSKMKKNYKKRCIRKKEEEIG